ncbi:MAG: hypothetical protein MO853_09975 [Candidatus Protistobacter heckmanni]|nr:hypothetical protein [Candidatus Protistobacter heckmanni]
MEAFNAKTPVAVRKLLARRPTKYNDALRKLRVPVLVTHGSEDQVSAPAMGEYTKKMVAQAKLSMYQGVGHGRFSRPPDVSTRNCWNWSRR